MIIDCSGIRNNDLFIVVPIRNDDFLSLFWNDDFLSFQNDSFLLFLNNDFLFIIVLLGTIVSSGMMDFSFPMKRFCRSIQEAWTFRSRRNDFAASFGNVPEQ